MCRTSDQRQQNPFHVGVFGVPRSYLASTSDGSDLESSVGGGGGGSADSAGSGSSQLTAQQQIQENSPHTPQSQDFTSFTDEVPLLQERQLNVTLANQSATPAFSDDSRNRSETGPFQRFQYVDAQSSIPSGNIGQIRSDFITLPPLISSSTRHYSHPSGRPSIPSAPSAAQSSSSSFIVTPSALHNQPAYPDAGDYLRHQLGLAPGTPVSLDCLPDPAPGQKPSQSYPILIKLAIYGSPKKMLTLQGIYEAIENRFEYFKKDKSGAWKRSIRHNLSLNRVFKGVPRPLSEPGKGSYWELDISQGEGYKRERKRRKRGSSARQQAKSRQGQQESDSDSQSLGEEEYRSEVSSASRSDSPAPVQREGRGIGPHRQAHTTALNRRSSPYPAGEPTMHLHTASPTWVSMPGYGYAVDAGRAEAPWGQGYVGSQGQVPQVGGYSQAPQAPQGFPLPMAMAGQEIPQQPVFRSGPFGHTVAWHALAQQQHMRQQGLPSSGDPAILPPFIAEGMQVGPGSAMTASSIVTGTMHTGNPQLGLYGEGHYHAFGQGELDEGPGGFKDDRSTQDREPRQGSR